VTVEAVVNGRLALPPIQNIYHVDTLGHMPMPMPFFP